MADKNTTEEYNGVGWSAGGNLITARCYLMGAGSQNAAVAAGGYPTQNTTEEYNGTSWSSANSLSIARYGLSGGGTQNSALAFAGFIGDYTCTEEYDGTNWSTKQPLINPRYYGGGNGADADNITAMGHFFTPGCVRGTAAHENFDGLAWSCKPPLLTTPGGNVAAGTTNASLSTGGYNGGVTAVTEEFNCGQKHLVGAGLQSFIANVTMETE